jgi:hypothetical protein
LDEACARGRGKPLRRNPSALIRYLPAQITNPLGALPASRSHGINQVADGPYAKAALPFTPFQNYASERVPSGTVGLVLGGVGFIRRRYETFVDVYLPLPRFGEWGPLADFDVYFHRAASSERRERKGRLITDESHDPGCDGETTSPSRKGCYRELGY